MWIIFGSKHKVEKNVIASEHGVKLAEKQLLAEIAVY